MCVTQLLNRVTYLGGAMSKAELVQAAPEDATATLSFKLFWGSYELRELGLFAGAKRIWRHNHLLQMTEQAQFEANSLNYPDFCREKYLPPVVRPVLAGS